jgi:hypothetical protein
LGRWCIRREIGSKELAAAALARYGSAKNRGHHANAELHCAVAVFTILTGCLGTSTSKLATYLRNRWLCAEQQGDHRGD